MLADRVEQANRHRGDEGFRAGADARRHGRPLSCTPPAAGRRWPCSLVGVQTALFIPAKYGILPELLPHEELSAGNGVLETISNLAMLAGLVGGA